MSIAEEIRELKPEKADYRKFGWVVGVAFLLLGGFLFWRGVGWADVLLWIGGALVVLGTVIPMLLKPVYFAWMSMAVVLGFVMTRVLLTLFFFLVLTPTALVMRLFRDPLHRKIDRQGAGTYWITKEYPIADRSRFEKFF